MCLRRDVDGCITKVGAMMGKPIDAEKKYSRSHDERGSDSFITDRWFWHDVNMSMTNVSAKIFFAEQSLRSAVDVGATNVDVMLVVSIVC